MSQYIYLVQFGGYGLVFPASVIVHDSTAGQEDIVVLSVEDVVVVFSIVEVGVVVIVVGVVIVVDLVLVVDVSVVLARQNGHSAAVGSMHQSSAGLNSWSGGHKLITSTPLASQYTNCEQSRGYGNRIPSSSGRHSGVGGHTGIVVNVTVVSIVVLDTDELGVVIVVLGVVSVVYLSVVVTQTGQLASIGSMHQNSVGLNSSPGGHILISPPPFSLQYMNKEQSSGYGKLDPTSSGLHFEVG
jgi:hypothetical protein